MLTAASEGDSAVGVAFPAGRTLYFLLHPWRYRGAEDIIGQGHYDPTTTHNLVLTDDSGAEIHPKPDAKVTTYDASPEDIKRCDLHPNDGDFSTCECEYPVPKTLEEALGNNMTFVSEGRGSVKTGPNERVSLQLRNKGAAWDEHAPFIVARVSASIVPAHSDIYTPRFVTFLAGYIHEFLREASRISRHRTLPQRRHLHDLLRTAVPRVNDTEAPRLPVYAFATLRRMFCTLSTESSTTSRTFSVTSATFRCIRFPVIGA